MLGFGGELQGSIVEVINHSYRHAVRISPEILEKASMEVYLP
jgi:hypothetical protein